MRCTGIIVLSLIQIDISTYLFFTSKPDKKYCIFVYFKQKNDMVQIGSIVNNLIPGEPVVKVRIDDNSVDVQITD